MKLITLNTWGGRIPELSSKFLQTYKDVDIFCFQEVYHKAHGKDTLWLDSTNFDLCSDIKDSLSGHQCLYHPHLGDWWGLAMHINKNFPIKESGERMIYKDKGYNPELELQGHAAKNIQYATIEINRKPVSIINIHGLWNGKGKTDTDDRLEQSRKVLEFTKTLSHDFVLCGDFNLLPETKSLKMFEEFGLRNLVKEYGITSTRTSFYKKPDKYADYIFVTLGIEVKDFKVLADEVSDHAPLYLEFELK